MIFKDSEFEMAKAYKEFKNDMQKIIDRKFSNADSIRNLEDNNQLALKLWNLPKFDTIEELKKWLDKEWSYKD
ncbi:MAG: hypothetical protein MR392_08895 [Roseburia sp.]|nr:hypothetical protein [Roseburia sp.]